MDVETQHLVLCISSALNILNNRLIQTLVFPIIYQYFSWRFIFKIIVLFCHYFQNKKKIIRRCQDVTVKLSCCTLVATKAKGTAGYQCNQWAQHCSLCRAPEATSAVLHPVLGPSVQEKGWWMVDTGGGTLRWLGYWRKGHMKKGQALLVWRGLKKLREELIAVYQYLQGGYREDRGKLFSEAHRDDVSWQRGKDH